MHLTPVRPSVSQNEKAPRPFLGKSYKKCPTNAACRCNDVGPVTEAFQLRPTE